MLINNVIEGKLYDIVKTPKASTSMDTFYSRFWENTSIKISKEKLRHILKHRLKYSYIKVNSRPFIILSNKNKLVKGLFWGKYLNMLSYNPFFINFDESNFSRNITKNYSWLQTGKWGIHIKCDHKREMKPCNGSICRRYVDMIFEEWHNKL